MKTILLFTVILGVTSSFALSQEASLDKFLKDVYPTSNHDAQCPSKIEFDFLKLLKDKKGQLMQEGLLTRTTIEMMDKAKLSALHTKLPYSKAKSEGGASLSPEGQTSSFNYQTGTQRLECHYTLNKTWSKPVPFKILITEETKSAKD